MINWFWLRLGGFFLSTAGWLYIFALVAVACEETTTSVKLVIVSYLCDLIAIWCCWKTISDITKRE